MANHIRVVFHGTSPEMAQIIQKEGLEAGSYVAHHLEDAIAFGGPVVLEITLRHDNWHMVFKLKYDDHEWQYITRCRIPPMFIEKIVHYNPEILYENDPFGINKVIGVHNPIMKLYPMI